MGCFSSKSAATSRSLRENLSTSLQRRTVGIPGLEDYLFASSKNSTVSGAAGDDFMALLCTANTVAMKLKEREEKLRQMSEPQAPEEEDRLTSYESGTDEPPAVTNGCGPENDELLQSSKGEEAEKDEEEVLFHESINAWELMAGLEENEEAANNKRAHAAGRELDGGHDGRGSVCKGRPVKEEQVREGNEGSCSCVEERRLSPSVEEDAPVDKQVISSNKIVEAAAPAVPTRACPDHADPVQKNAQLQKNPLSDVPTEPLKPIPAIKPAATTSPLNSNPPPTAALRALDYSDSFRFKDSFALRDDDNESEKGIKRKARSKELKPLDVPVFEFKDIQNWLQGNDQGLYDPDPYETPKFGNYIRSIAKARKDAAAADGELDPDLVATLQETIDGMSAEEERILKQFIDEFLDQVQSGGGGGTV